MSICQGGQLAHLIQAGALVNGLGRSPSSGDGAVLVLDGQIDAERISDLCEQLHALIEHSGARRVVCDVGRLEACNLRAIDALARLKLTAMRLGCDFQLGRPSDRLVALIAFLGLGSALPASGGSST